MSVLRMYCVGIASVPMSVGPLVNTPRGWVGFGGVLPPRGSRAMARPRGGDPICVRCALSQPHPPNAGSVRKRWQNRQPVGAVWRSRGGLRPCSARQGRSGDGEDCEERCVCTRTLRRLILSVCRGLSTLLANRLEWAFAFCPARTAAEGRRAIADPPHRGGDWVRSALRSEVARDPLEKVRRTNVGSPPRGSAMARLRPAKAPPVPGHFAARAVPPGPLSPPAVTRQYAVRRGAYASIPSNTSMNPAIIDSPLSQNAGSPASSPNGAKSSLWCFEPPAFSISKYFSWNPSPPSS